MRVNITLLVGNNNNSDLTEDIFIIFSNKIEFYNNRPNGHLISLRG